MCFSPRNDCWRLKQKSPFGLCLFFSSLSRWNICDVKDLICDISFLWKGCFLTPSICKYLNRYVRYRADTVYCPEDAKRLKCCKMEWQYGTFLYSQVMPLSRLHTFYIANSSAEPRQSMSQRRAHTAKWGWKRHWFNPPRRYKEGLREREVSPHKLGPILPLKAAG